MAERLASRTAAERFYCRLKLSHLFFPFFAKYVCLLSMPVDNPDTLSQVHDELLA